MVNCFRLELPKLKVAKQVKCFGVLFQASLEDDSDTQEASKITSLCSKQTQRYLWSVLYCCWEHSALYLL